MELTVGRKFEVRNKPASIIDRIVKISPILQKIDNRLRKYKPIHLCWLFEKLSLSVPRYLIAESSIDVGTSCDDREYYTGDGETHINRNNPANASGVLTSICIYMNTSGNVKIGVFDVVSGNTLKCRSAYNCGYLSAGYHSFSVNMAISAGDYIGAYSAGRKEYIDTAGSGVWAIGGDTCVVNNQSAYAAHSPGTMSLYGAGVTIPTAPSNCASHYVATNNAKCTWNDNSGIETNFRIEKAIDGAGFSFWKNVGAGVTDSGTYTLGANHRIKFQVRAYNAAGSSAYSISGYAYTTPAAPTGATTAYVATNLAKLTWSDQSAYESGFALEYAYGAAGWAFWKNVGAGVQTSGNGSPGANTRAKFRVRAYIGSLYSAYSTGSYIYTIPTTPSEIALSWLVQNETVRITWTDNSAYEQDFDIERDTDDAGFAHIVYDVASPYDDEAPSGGGHKYKYRVRARCPDGRLSGWNTSDYIYSYIIFEKTVTETIALSDTVSRVVSWHRTFTEILSLTDTIKKALSKTFSEIITLSDVLFKKILKTFTENITLTGTITKIKRNLFLLLKKLRDLLDIEGH